MKSTLRWIAALLAVISITGAALAGDSWKTCPVSLEARSPLDQLMRRDMFYGADDYFGADRDLLYSDNVKPSCEPGVPAEQAYVSPTRRGGGSSDSSSNGGGSVYRRDDQSAVQPGDPRSNSGAADPGTDNPGGQDDPGGQDAPPDEPDEPEEDFGGG